MAPDLPTIYAPANFVKLWTVTGLPWIWAYGAPTVEGWCHGSPAVAGGKVYLHTYSNAYCWAASTGSNIWTRTDLESRLSGYTGTGPYSDSTPCIWNGKVFIHARDTMHCLDASTGAKLWKTVIGTDDSSPLVADGVLVCGSITGVHGLNPDTGVELWLQSQAACEGMERSSVARWVSNGKSYIIANCGTTGGWPPGYQLCLDPLNNGSVVWSVAGGGGYATPAVSGDYLEIESSGQILGYRISPTGATNLWNLYQTGGNNNKNSTACIYNGYAYQVCLAGLKCIKMDTGAEQWANIYGAGENSYNSPVIAGSRLFFQPNGGNQIVIVDTNPSNQCTQVGTIGGLEGSWASPAIADGKLFLKDKTSLICYQIADTTTGPTTTTTTLPGQTTTTVSTTTTTTASSTTTTVPGATTTTTPTSSTTTTTAGSGGAGVLMAWNMSGISPAGGNSPWSATTVGANMQSANLSRNDLGVGATDNQNAYTGYNAGNMVTGISRNNAQYMRFTVTPAGGYQITLTGLQYSICAQSSPSALFDILCSTDGFATTNTLVSGGSACLDDTPGLQTAPISAINNFNGSVEFRIYWYRLANGWVTVQLGYNPGANGLVVSGTAAAVGSTTTTTTTTTTSTTTTLALTVTGLAVPMPGNNAIIRWQSASNQVYSLLGGSSLLCGLPVMASNLAATPPVNTYTDTFGAGGAPPQKFYRVQVQH